ncbi:MAG: hypothetical protein IPM33_05120 [Phycisphaerales bacterium]|nr:hypothetical protein [Phycisphaerales bacterium]
MIRQIALLLGLCLALGGLAPIAHAQSLPTTYQGRLSFGGNPANGIYDFVFRVFDDLPIGAPDNQIGASINRTLTVVGGLFTTEFNFSPGTFNGSTRWLQIEVRPSGGGAYTILSPRQTLSATPQATIAEGLVLPYFGAGGPSSPSGYVLSILNNTANGAGIGGFGPNWGVVGQAGVITVYPSLTTPAGITGIGTGAGVTGASENGYGVVGGSITGTGGYFFVPSTSSYTAKALEARVMGPNAGSAGEFVNTHALNANPTLRVTNAAVNFGAVAIHATNSAPTSNAYVIRAEQLSTTGTAIYATTAGTGVGVSGISLGGTGVFANGGGPNGTGVEALGWGAGNAVRADGRGNAVGIYATSGTTAGRFVTVSTTNSNPTLVAENDSTISSAFAVHGIINSTSPGVFSAGVRGENRGTGGPGVGVYGSHAGNGFGVYGTTAGASGYAGYFQGRVHVTGALTKGSGTFKIDHPLDPENKYLSHSFVESPDMMNVYNGNIRTDEGGLAVVELPAYFEALNREFRYQLTVIDESDNDFIFAKVLRPVAANRFVIKTSQPDTLVSWQVTGIRQDAFARANPVVPEVEKTKAERGRYLHPEAFGLPASRGLIQDALQADK